MTEAEFTTLVLVFIKETLDEGWSHGEILAEVQDALRFYAREARR